MTDILRPASVIAPPSAGTVSVMLLDGTTARVAAATSGCNGVVAGDQVLVVSAAGQLWAIAKAGGSTGSTPSSAPVRDGDTFAPTPMSSVGTSVIFPSWSGTWSDNTWRGDTQAAIQGADGTAGAIFWNDLTALGAIDDAAIRLSPIAGGPTTIGLLGGPWDPAAFPPVITSVAGPDLSDGATTSWTAPADWYAQLASGTATGIGLVGDDRCAVDGAAATITLSWSN